MDSWYTSDLCLVNSNMYAFVPAVAPVQKKSVSSAHSLQAVACSTSEFGSRVLRKECRDRNQRERDRESGKAGRLPVSRKACAVICLVSNMGFNDFCPIRPLKKYLAYSVAGCVRCKELRECRRHSSIKNWSIYSITLAIWSIRVRQIERYVAR
jgi:hypothetical protein